MFYFFGPGNFVGTGGAGVALPVTPERDGSFKITFQVPRSYPRSKVTNGQIEVVPVKPGRGYSFTAYPLGICSVPFTVAAR